MAVNTELPSKILVFGATGAIGKYIILELYHARTSFTKIGFFTSHSTAKSKPDEVQGWKDKGVEVIIGNVNSEEDVAKAYEGTCGRSSHSCISSNTGLVRVELTAFRI